MRVWFPYDPDGSIDLKDRFILTVGLYPGLLPPEVPPNYTSYLRKFLGDTSITQAGSMQQQSTMTPQTISGLNLNYLRKFLGDS